MRNTLLSSFSILNSLGKSTNRTLLSLLLKIWDVDKPQHIAKWDLLNYLLIYWHNGKDCSGKDVEICYDSAADDLCKYLGGTKKSVLFVCWYQGPCCTVLSARQPACCCPQMFCGLARHLPTWTCWRSCWAQAAIWWQVGSAYWMMSRGNMSPTHWRCHIEMGWWETF